MNDSDKNFSDWYRLVDREVRRITSVSVYDLADWDSREAFDAGVSPEDAAIEAIENDGTYDVLDEIYDD